ncbi:MAG: hypothetical protein U0Y68_13510 [Blastocatellia bacterium]
MSIIKKNPHTICGCCGRSMEKAVAVYEDTAYCGTCYKREFKQVACSDCGRTIRTLGGRTPGLCKTCQTKDRFCVRCAKPVPRVSLTVETGIACPSCARHFKEPQCCPVCGQFSLYLARDFRNGFTEPVCQRCRRKGFINCPVCGKNRRPEGTNQQGQVVCKLCLENDGKAFICPKCNKEGQRHSHKRCVACYWRDYTEQRFYESLAMLTKEWVRQAYAGFYRELVDRMVIENAAMRLQKYFLFFAKLDAAFDKATEISADSLIRYFGLEGLRRQVIPYGYLVKAKIIPAIDDEALHDGAELYKQRALLQKAESTWYVSLLNRFHQHMLSINERYRRRGWVGKLKRFIPHTITRNLRAAIKFLASLDAGKIHSIQQVDQTHLDIFVAQHPGYRDGLRSFVRYVNKKEKLFRSLKLISVTGDVREGVFLGASRYQELLAKWLTPSAGELKESLICLLMLLYGQRPVRLVRLKVADLSRMPDGLYKIIFGSVELILNERISTLFDRYLTARRSLATMEDSWENNWLFPGRTLGSHITEAAIAYYLQKHDLKAESLFATSLYYAYLSGLRQPKVLVKALGITDLTAIKYFKLIDARLRDEVEKKVVNG